MATETKQLFDKPLGERREAFVRNRFGETAVFGQPDVEEWLALQRKAGRPDPLWGQFLAHNFMVMCAATSPISYLLERASSSRFTPTSGRALDHVAELYVPLLTALDSGPSSRTALYHGTTRMVLLVGAEPRDRVAYVIEKGYGTNHPSGLPVDGANLVFTPLTTRAGKVRGAESVLDILFAEWDRQRQKCREARSFLCDALAEKIKQERTKAEADFDSAVAVSPDGTKIVHADWVVVLGHDGEGKDDLKFPASALAERKALFTGPCSDCSQFKERFVKGRWEGQEWYEDPNGRVATVAEWLATSTRPATAWRWGDYGKVVLHTRACRSEQKLFCLSDGRVLLTHREQCPSPLPDGGVKVRA